jgi:hypothetical protein
MWKEALVNEPARELEESTPEVPAESAGDRAAICNAKTVATPLDASAPRSAAEGQSRARAIASHIVSIAKQGLAE